MSHTRWSIRKQAMMTSLNGNISALLAICAGNLPVPGEFPSQRPVTRSLMFSLICVWIKGWENNRDAGDLRRYRAHYDVIVMIRFKSCIRRLNAWSGWPFIIRVVYFQYIKTNLNIILRNDVYFTSLLHTFHINCNMITQCKRHKLRA